MMYSPFRHIDSIFRKHRPIHLTFFITRRCNAQCPFCFYISNEQEGSNGELNLDEIGRFSASLGKLLWLAFSGGEIFLRNDIDEITRIFYRQNEPSMILFPTNGLLTDTIREKIEAVLKTCTRSTVIVKLSLEGTEPVHDSIRGRRSFEKTLNTYNALEELTDRYPNLELGVNTVFLSTNQDKMAELIEVIRSLDKIRTHTVSLIRGNVPDKNLKNIDVGKYLDTINTLELYVRKRKSSVYRFKGAKLKAAQDILQRRLIYETVTRNKQLIPCYAGRLNLVLTETGEMYPCESFSMNMGNIRDNGYDAIRILRSGRAQNVINTIQNNGCYCTHECYLMTNILFNPRMYPALLKEYLKVRLDL
jgi:radical SAM protein with 4Fe4S-binding SPASM domain